jgi:DNA-directed RNA polymerase specialized sigma24 family protein
MTAKEYLSQIRRIETRLRAMSEQHEYLRSAALCITARISDMPGSATRNNRNHEDAIIRVLELEERMSGEFQRLADINAVINSMSDPQQLLLLVKRYVSGKTWNEIARDLFVSLRAVHRLHGAALAEIEKLAHVGTQRHTQSPCG